MYVCVLKFQLQKNFLFSRDVRWFLPLSFFHKCFPVAHLWPFQNPSLCTFLFLQPTHYEQQDLGGLSETIQR